MFLLVVQGVAGTIMAIFVKDHPALATRFVPVLPVASSALSGSATVKPRSAIVRAIAAVSLACDDAELDVADVVAYLRPAYSSDNYLVRTAYVGVLGKLLLKRRCSDRLYLNILPAFLSYLGDDCDVLRKKAEHYWEKAASTNAFGFDASMIVP